MIVAGLHGLGTRAISPLLREKRLMGDLCRNPPDHFQVLYRVDMSRASGAPKLSVVGDGPIPLLISSNDREIARLRLRDWMGLDDGRL